MKAPRSLAVPMVVMLFAGSGLPFAGSQSLPAGVKRIAFGRAVTTKDPAKGVTCTIPEALASPVEFTSGVTEISFLVEIDPQKARQVKASILGDLGSSETKGVNCNAYSICAGAVCQTQFGNTVSRVDGKPLKPGTYTLALEVDGQSTKVPFVIK